MARRRVSRWLKLLDRYAGIPALFVLGATRRRQRFDPTAARRIGLMKTAAIGDTLLLSGLIDDVRRTFPAATLVFIVGPDNAAAAELLQRPGDESVVVSPREARAAIRAVRSAKLDVIVDFGAWPRFDAMLAALSNARFRLGFRTPRQFRHAAFDRAVQHSDRAHERENYAALLAELGVKAVTPARLPPSRVLDDAKLPPRPYAVFHAWSGGFMHEVKEWPAERWVELAGVLAKRGWNIALTGGAADRAETEALAERIRAAGGAPINVAGSYTLAELTDVLASSEVVVSVNTGVMHLAGLVGARTVSLEGPAPTLRWGPIGPFVRPVVTDLPGCGYLNLGFEYSGQRLDCMLGISVAAVAAAIDELVALSDARPVESASRGRA